MGCRICRVGSRGLVLRRRSRMRRRRFMDRGLRHARIQLRQSHRGIVGHLGRDRVHRVLVSGCLRLVRLRRGALASGTGRFATVGFHRSRTSFRRIHSRPESMLAAQASERRLWQAMPAAFEGQSSPPAPASQEAAFCVPDPEAVDEDVVEPEDDDDFESDELPDPDPDPDPESELEPPLESPDETLSLFDSEAELSALAAFL